MKAKIKVSGMHCESCARRIELELEDLRGLEKITVNSKTGICDVEFAEAVLTLGKIKEQINKLGYVAD